MTVLVRLEQRPNPDSVVVSKTTVHLNDAKDIECLEDFLQMGWEVVNVGVKK